MNKEISLKIENFIKSLLSEYEKEFGPLEPPINLYKLAWLRNIRIKSAPSDAKFEGILMPIRERKELTRKKDPKFIIYYRSEIPGTRRNLTICHEIAHTFFYDTSTNFPKRKNDGVSGKDEEILCFKIARELLIPEISLRKTFFEYSNLSPLQLLRKLSVLYQASLHIMAKRLTEDTNLLSNTMFIFWYSKGNSNLKPNSVSFKDTQEILKKGFRHLYINCKNSVVYQVISEIAATGRIRKEWKEIGKRKRVRFYMEVEPINPKYIISALSSIQLVKRWGSGLHSLLPK